MFRATARTVRQSLMRGSAAARPFLSANRGRIAAFAGVAGVAGIAGSYAARYGILPMTSVSPPAAASAEVAPRAGRIKRYIRSRFKQKSHNYTVSTPVYTLEPNEDPKVAANLVYQALRKHAAPGAGGIQVTENAEGNYLKVTFLGTVRSTASPEDLSVTNQTQDDHWLHDGQVVRRVVVRGREIHIDTVGTGTGMLPKLNEMTAGFVWSPIDRTISREANQMRGMMSGITR